MNRETRLARLEARAAHRATIDDRQAGRPAFSFDAEAFSTLFADMFADLPDEVLAEWSKEYAGWSRSCSPSLSR